MGTDARILYHTKDGEEADGLWLECSDPVINEPGWFEVDYCGRYWTPDYRRGNWPLLLGMMAELLDSENVDQVTYGGDDLGEPRKVTRWMLLKYTAEFLQTEI